MLMMKSGLQTSINEKAYFIIAFEPPGISLSRFYRVFVTSPCTVIK